jgi:hypothetical protein
VTRETILRLPAPLRVCAQLFAPTGEHRARPHAAVVDQEFVYCPTCEVETAATRHGDVLRCTENHLVEGVV